MEKYYQIGGLKMKKYSKPLINNLYPSESAIPAALAVSSLSKAAAFTVGAASGLMLRDIHSKALLSVNNNSTRFNQ